LNTGLTWRGGCRIWRRRFQSIEEAERFGKRVDEISLLSGRPLNAAVNALSLVRENLDY